MSKQTTAVVLTVVVDGHVPVRDKPPPLTVCQFSRSVSGSSLFSRMGKRGTGTEETKGPDMILSSGGRVYIHSARWFQSLYNCFFGAESDTRLILREEGGVFVSVPEYEEKARWCFFGLWKDVVLWQTPVWIRQKVSNAALFTHSSANWVTLSLQKAFMFLFCCRRAKRFTAICSVPATISELP